jgi:hypothetical protein
MKQHFVYFYGSTKIIKGFNSNSEESVRKRNQIIGFDGIDIFPDMVEFGETCFNKLNENGSRGETGTLYPKNITIVPFRYMYQENLIVKHLEDVILANENYIKADSIGFPLMRLKEATNEGYNLLGKDWSFNIEREKEFKKQWCCFGHYYIKLLVQALSNKGYSAKDIRLNEYVGNLINKVFFNEQGKKLEIHADAGL